MKAEEWRRLDGPADPDEEWAIACADRPRAGPTLGVGREDFEESKERRAGRHERRSFRDVPSGRLPAGSRFASIMGLDKRPSPSLNRPACLLRP